MEGREDLLQVLWLPVGELMPVLQVCHAWPSVLFWGSQDLEDVQQLLQLAVTWEERSLHFAQSIQLHPKYESQSGTQPGQQMEDTIYCPSETNGLSGNPDTPVQSLSSAATQLFTFT